MVVKINNKSDFKINESSETVAMEVPFVFSYYVFDSKKYVVSFDGHNYVNCERKEDGSLDVIFNQPEFGIGHLKVERKYAVDDKAFADGVFDVVTVDKTDVFITSGQTFETYVKTLVVPPYLKGDKGDPMTWETMTEKERGELVKDVAEAIDPEMVMTKNEKSRQEAEQSRQTAEQQRSTTFNTLKGEMQSAITAGNAAAGNAQKVVDNYDMKVAEQDSKLTELGLELRTMSPIKNTYNSGFLKYGFVDGGNTVYTEITSNAVKYMTLEVSEKMVCTLTSVRRNAAFMYIIYNANNERIAYYAGENNEVLTTEFVIPEGGVKLAVNCDVLFIESFALETILESLTSRVNEQEKESGNIYSKLEETDKKILGLQEQLSYNSDMLEKDNAIVTYNASDLSKGYVDGSKSELTVDLVPNYIKNTIIDVTFGDVCELTTARYNNGYNYIIYNSNNERIAYYIGTNKVLEDSEFIIPEGGVKLAVNCAVECLEGFALSITRKTIQNRVSEIEKEITSEQETFEYDSSSLSNGYVDGNADTYTETANNTVKYLTLAVEEGMKCTLTSVRRNLGYMYIIYDANDEKIAAFAGTNATVLTKEFTIPKGGVKLAVNCDAAYLDSFALSIVGLPTLLSRVMELEKENVGLEVLSAKNRIVYTLGSSMIDLMKTTTNENGVKDWAYLGELLRVKKLYNIAIGGSTWQWQGVDTDTPDINNTATRFASNQIKMLKRLVDSGKYEYPDIIFLQFTNGYSGSGTITDNMEQVMAMSFDELEKNTSTRQTFYGGVRYALELLNRYFPKATYYVSDGIQCDRDLPYRRGYEYVKSGRDALKKMCDRYSCPFLETSRNVGIIDLYEHGSKTSTSNIEVLSGATSTGTVTLSLKDNNIDVQVTTGDTASVVAQKIVNAVNSSNIGWAATLNGSKVLLSVAKESAAVPEFNAASTGVSVDITFNQFADDYDGIYLSTDGLHPNEKGKKLMARSVAKGILESYFQKQ